MRDILSDLEDGLLLSDPDPTRRAQKQMRTPLPKRFYESAAVEREDGGFAVRLDGKPVRTPGRAVLVLPTQAAAQLVADEWNAQGEEINPVTMPVLRLVNTAIDGVSRETDAVAEDILRFSASDLLLYRAEAPQGLVDRQRSAWDPVLDWAAGTLHARFVLAEGVMPVEQPRAAVAAVGIHLAGRREPLRLASLHLMTSLMGSALLALAVEAGAIEADAAWKAAHVDEDWNAEAWGHDSEAIARHNGRQRDMMAAVALLRALSPA
jgi:chaperone required for assembly of F1-ATPase